MVFLSLQFPRDNWVKESIFSKRASFLNWFKSIQEQAAKWNRSLLSRPQKETACTKEGDNSRLAFICLIKCIVQACKIYGTGQTYEAGKGTTPDSSRFLGWRTAKQRAFFFLFFSFLRTRTTTTEKSSKCSLFFWPPMADDSTEVKIIIINRNDIIKPVFVHFAHLWLSLQLAGIQLTTSWVLRRWGNLRVLQIWSVWSHICTQYLAQVTYANLYAHMHVYNVLPVLVPWELTGAFLGRWPHDHLCQAHSHAPGRRIWWRAAGTWPSC